MQAKETKLQDIIEGTKQYIIPLFQRTYSWTAKEWDILWKDLVELSEMDNPRTHFIGSIVNMPTVSVPEGVAKYLLIDGQQRITTIFILLTLLRNKAHESHSQRFADEINNTLLVNPFKDGLDYFKLMPTQVDRKPYIDLINGKKDEAENQLTKCYAFFENKLKQSVLDPEKIKKIVTSYFSVVSIVLDSDDNPYLVFESLNAKGRPLTQADLIRNYFFMRIHVDQQDSVYQDYWYPMQQALGDNLTEFIRHFLMRTGSFIKQSDVYYSLKAQVSSSNAIEYLQELRKFSIYYHRILNSSYEPHPVLKRYFSRLNRIEVTTAYPLILYFYDNYEQGFISVDEFVTILKTLENYLIRRFVCSVPTNQLNKIFSAVVPQLISKFPENVCEGFQLLLQDKGYPKDFEFLARFKDTNFYGAGDRREKTKFVLETIEESYEHKESPSFANLTIEHIMPQTLDEWWQHHLGEAWQDTFDRYLDTIGNLTLTAYNSELSNDKFSNKRLRYNESHLELNKYFSSLTQWTETVRSGPIFLLQEQLKFGVILGKIAQVVIYHLR